ncbi:hypothetical protein DOY81_015403, partial [Sarcophaga bullata]
ALTKYQTSQKVTTKTGIEQEETLLNESAARETSLNLQILDLENEVKQLRHELERVEFEGAKHEIRRLTEELELLNQQVDELTNLKKIAEKQMEEALEALQGERETKYALKKELDSHLN